MDIELVIKIPEEAYNLLKGDGVDWLGAEHILSCVEKGKILPKGHGRLIDADAVLEEPIGDTYRDINIAETIIEAESEG